MQSIVLIMHEKQYTIPCMLSNLLALHTILIDKAIFQFLKSLPKKKKIAEDQLYLVEQARLCDGKEI